LAYIIGEITRSILEDGIPVTSQGKRTLCITRNAKIRMVEQVISFHPNRNPGVPKERRAQPRWPGIAAAGMRYELSPGPGYKREIAHARGAFPVPSFLGGATDFAHAKPITVASGDDSRVGDTVLPTERRFAVRGTFQDYDSSLRYSVLLKDPPLSDAEPMFSVGCGRIPPKYSDLLTKVLGPNFEIEDVPPGKYLITAGAALPAAPVLCGTRAQ
jgi:hypothetical protein